VLASLTFPVAEVVPPALGTTTDVLVTQTHSHMHTHTKNENNKWRHSLLIVREGQQ
jgi:hypothetical protein